MTKKRKRPTRGIDSLDLIGEQLKPDKKDLKKKAKIIEGKIDEDFPPEILPKKSTLLDMYRVDAFVEFGHPDNILMKLVNKNMSMMNWIEIEMERVKDAVKNENGESVGPFDLQLAYLHKQFGDSVESKLIKLKIGWEEMNNKQIDETFLLQAYKNVSFFIEFLKTEAPDMISPFIAWRTKQMADPIEVPKQLPEEIDSQST